MENFVPQADQDAKLVQFEISRQGEMSVKEYYIEFVQLSKYATAVICDERDRIQRFIAGVGDYIHGKTYFASFAPGCTFTSIVGVAKHLEDRKRQQREREHKKARFNSSVSGKFGGF